MPNNFEISLKSRSSLSKASAIFFLGVDIFIRSPSSLAKRSEIYNERLYFLITPSPDLTIPHLHLMEMANCLRMILTMGLGDLYLLVDLRERDASVSDVLLRDLVEDDSNPIPWNLKGVDNGLGHLLH